MNGYHQNIEGFSFHPNLNAMRRRLLQHGHQIDPRVLIQTQAAFSPRTGKLYLDGLDPDDEVGLQEGGLPGLYAHELGHAVDGRASEHSGSEGWLEATADDRPTLKAFSAYGASNPSEAFAEFYRLLHGFPSDVHKHGPRWYQAIERHLPNMTRYFKEQSLWPTI